MRLLCGFGRLIREMTAEDSIWGEDRIANELKLRLGIRALPRKEEKCSAYRAASDFPGLAIFCSPLHDRVHPALRFLGSAHYRHAWTPRVSRHV